MYLILCNVFNMYMHEYEYNMYIGETGVALILYVPICIV